MQKIAIRNINSTKYNSHTDPLFKQNKTLKFNDLYTLNSGILMCKISMGTQPKTITDMFKQSEHFGRTLNFNTINSHQLFN